FQDKQFTVIEGDTQDVGHGTNLSIRLDKFTDTYSEMGVASQYTSDITILDDGKDVKSGQVTPNHPVSYNNATIYQASLAYAKQFKITDTAGNVIFDDASTIGIFNQKGNPDAPAGFVDLPAINSQLIFVGPDAAPFNQPQLDTLHLTSNQLWVQLSTKDSSGNYVSTPGQKITLNQPVKIGGYTIAWNGTRNVSMLQVAYNPGVPIFIIAAVLLVGGLVVIFYFPHRRVRGIATTTPAGATLQLAPLAKRDWSGKHDFVRLIEAAQARLGEPQELKLPKSGSEWESYTRSSSASS
ncbi:MAG TPA: cytochrome c biogenesis protein ResB, partial [Thermomicrobiales bacterium]|nr:cytochrome c biogenesis protein ResB [Thermomicrobiales bacterium]